MRRVIFSFIMAWCISTAPHFHLNLLSGTVKTKTCNPTTNLAGSSIADVFYSKAINLIQNCSRPVTLRFERRKTQPPQQQKQQQQQQQQQKRGKD